MYAYDSKGESIPDTICMLYMLKYAKMCYMYRDIHDVLKECDQPTKKGVN